MKIALIGDVMLGRNLNQAVSSGGPGYPWGDTLPVLEEADLRLVNLECVISDRGAPSRPDEKAFHFRAAPPAVDALKAAKIDYVSLANNHSLDYGGEALLDMIARLDAAGIKHAGAGAGPDEASEPAILEAGGMKIGVISASDNEPGWLAREGEPGINFTPTLIRPEVLEKIAKEAKAARAKGADVVVFSDHWGPNMRERPSSLYSSFAHDVLGLGIDIFHGHSAHVFQGIEIWGRKPILFDTGDFVDDYAVDVRLRNDWSFIFMLDIDERAKNAKKLELVPVHISGCQANLARGPIAEAICRKMEALCGEFGTKTKMHHGRLVIDRF